MATKAMMINFFAARRETLAELWKRATTDGYQNDIISKAIRIGCLSNRAVDKYKFPLSVIGNNETQRCLPPQIMMKPRRCLAMSASMMIY